MEKSIIRQNAFYPSLLYKEQLARPSTKITARGRNTQLAAHGNKSVTEYTRINKSYDLASRCAASMNFTIGTVGR